MRPYDVIACIENETGEYICADCLPCHHEDCYCDDYFPICMLEEFDYQPHCAKCDKKLEPVALINEDDEEAE